MMRKAHGASETTRNLTAQSADSMKLASASVMKIVEKDTHVQTLFQSSSSQAINELERRASALSGVTATELAALAASSAYVLYMESFYKC